ncbi:unnamed protein product, partial [Symbiodinium sp. KB8]
MTSEAKATAIKNYASHAKLDPNHVTIEMVQATSQGALHWATVHMDMSARGAASQAMSRALKYKPDVKAMYSLMLDSFKGEFRRAWSCCKDFQFVKTAKTTGNTYRKKREDAGTYKTYLQLVQILGGSDQPIAKQQAQNYVDMCTRDDLKEYCVLYNSWLKAETYLWVEHLISTSNIEEWTSSVSVECTETIPDSWAEKVEISKAMRCFAAEHGKRLVDVTEEEVRQSDLGVAGYAAKFETVPAAQPRPGGDGSAAGKGNNALKRPATEESIPDGEKPPPTEGGTEKKKPRGGNGNLAGKKEKEVKELLAQEQSSDNAMSSITIDMSKGDSASWAWASGFVKSYKDCRVQVLQLYADNPFFQSMKVAVLSAKELQRVKKEYKDQYLPKLCDFVSTMGPKISAMAEASAQIQLMAAAKQNASESSKATA